MNEAPVHVPPQSTNVREIKLSAAVIVGTERLPKEVLTNTVINPRAVHYLHPGVQYLATSQYLEEHAYMIVPRSKSERTILTPKYGGRLIPIAYGVIPYASIIGGRVSAKGVYVSGEYYEQDEEPGENRALGFFRTNGAEKEIKVANELLDNEFRSTLPLGYIELHKDILKAWLIEKYPDKADLVKRRLERLGNDSICIMFRIQGVGERLINTIPNVERKKRREVELARAGRLLKLEQGTGPVNNVLGKIASKVKLDKVDFATYIELVTGIFAQNAHALQKIYSNYLPGRSHYWIGSGLLLSRGRDIDLTMVTGDFESLELKDIKPDADKEVSDYIRQTAHNLDAFFADRFFYLEDAQNLTPETIQEMIRVHI